MVDPRGAHRDPVARRRGRLAQREAGRLGPWLFSSDLAHRHRLGAEVLGHRFAAIRDQAGVTDATGHRLCHSVATFLVARGQVLQAPARLGRADAATTLREYAYALPLSDRSIADAIDHHLGTVVPSAIPDGRLPSLSAADACVCRIARSGRPLSARTWPAADAPCAR